MCCCFLVFVNMCVVVCVHVCFLCVGGGRGGLVFCVCVSACGGVYMCV